MYDAAYRATGRHELVQLTHEISVKQQAGLIPRLQRSVRLLHMSTLEFSQEIAEAIANNPFLEEREGDALPAHASSGLAGDAACAATASEDAAQTAALEAAAQSASSLASGDSGIDGAATQYCEPQADPAGPVYSGDYPAPSRGEGGEPDIGQWAHSEPGLREALHENLCGYCLAQRDRLLVEFIIEALDEDGYLRIELGELAHTGQLVPPAQRNEWEVALRLVQQLAAPGIGARNLGECLQLQLRALDEATPQRTLALRIVCDALDKLGRCDYAGLARLFCRPESDIRQACALIRTLDPRPASRYTRISPSCYVTPDACVRRIGRQWVAAPNHDAWPKVRLHGHYAQLLRESRYGERSLMAGALQEARWLMRSLEQRKTTIQRVAQAIVARQQTFFDYGAIALRPMMLSEIADELGMHESTVSRATSNKYLATPRGIYEFKHFFSRELATRAGGTCSAAAVRALIREMIEEENPSDPLSDVTLAENLAREGVQVARRTVSKYRAQIKYPPAELRRSA